MNKNELIHLKVKPREVGVSIELDEKEIHHVENYKIESAPLPGTAKVTIEMLVQYP